ncbi:glycine zipper domain-containing protein [Paracoccus haeundaensis]|uniref:DUF883 family protein n=1 Tax=Paracoccus haeundaensis TaxID=225362 RepID=A0A5C4R1D4_9RHOB|nr:DUF883 family protein [Paracoccus haeundaensis]TNH37780.1 DUF883 family protein [Paracoccus haeundaensis]
MVQKPPVKTDRNVNAAANDTSIPYEAGTAGLVERGAALADGALNVSREYVGPLRKAGQDHAKRLYKAGGQRAQEAAFYAELGYEETRDLVRGYPVQALGIAAGVGVLLGLLVARR